MIRESTGRGSTLGIASHPLTTRRATTHVEAYALGMVSAADRAEQQQAGEKLRAADYGDSGLVFATGKGTPLDAQNIINRFFKPLLKRAELPDIRWHDLATPTPTFYSPGAPTRPTSRSLWDTRRSSSPSTATPTGCPRWAATPLTG